MKAYCCFEPQARTQDYDAGRFGTRGRGKRACGVGPYSWSRSAVQQGVLENVRLLSANTIILNRIHYTRPDFSLHSSLTLLGFIFLVMAHSVYTHPLPFRLCGTGPPVSVCSYVPLTPAPLTPPNCNVASSGGAARGEASRSFASVCGCRRRLNAKPLTSGTRRYFNIRLGNVFARSLAGL